MLLYFPSVKIIRCDLIPSVGAISHLFYFKSQLNSPKHYPNHPLIEGKIEFAEKIEAIDTFKFWCKAVASEDNPKNLKGKIISVLVDFDPSRDKKFILCGFGTKNNNAYHFHNRDMKLSPDEMKAKLNYELKPQKIEERKKTKI